MELSDKIHHQLGVRTCRSHLKRTNLVAAWDSWQQQLKTAVNRSYHSCNRNNSHFSKLPLNAVIPKEARENVLISQSPLGPLLCCLSKRFLVNSDQWRIFRDPPLTQNLVKWTFAMIWGSKPLLVLSQSQSLRECQAFCRQVIINHL